MHWPVKLQWKFVFGIGGHFCRKDIICCECRVRFPSAQSIPLVVNCIHIALTFLYGALVRQNTRPTHAELIGIDAVDLCCAMAALRSNWFANNFSVQFQHGSKGPTKNTSANYVDRVTLEHCFFLARMQMVKSSSKKTVSAPITMYFKWEPSKCSLSSIFRHHLLVLILLSRFGNVRPKYQITAKCRI